LSVYAGIGLQAFQCFGEEALDVRVADVSLMEDGKQKADDMPHIFRIQPAGIGAERALETAVFLRLVVEDEIANVLLED
jgi:hypothetical protein